MFGWLSAKDAIAQGQEIAQLVRGLLEKAEARGFVRTEGKVREKFDRLVERAVAAARSRRFNMLQKAKFANALKWDLREAGYPDEFIDDFVTALLVRMR